MRLGWVIKILEDGRLILARAASVGISRRRSANNFFFFLFSNDCQGAAKFKSRRQEATTTKHKNISRGNTTNLQTHTPAAGECFFSFGEGIYYSRTLPRASIIKIRRKTKQNFQQLSKKKKKMGNKCIFISYLMFSCAPYCSAASCM